MENKTSEDVKPDYHEIAIQHFAHIKIDFKREVERDAATWGFEEACEHVAEPLRSELTKLKNDLLDALGLKEGKGPTALSMLSNELTKLREENEEFEKLFTAARNEIIKYNKWENEDSIPPINIVIELRQLTSQLSKAKELLKECARYTHFASLRTDIEDLIKEIDNS